MTDLITIHLNILSRAHQSRTTFTISYYLSFFEEYPFFIDCRKKTVILQKYLSFGHFQNVVRKKTVFIIDKIHPEEVNYIRVPKSTEHRI